MVSCRNHSDWFFRSRADFSDVHSFEARQAFVRNIASGEAGINLADAAFQIAAEDDALVSHSSVKLPILLYAKRMQRMAEDIARNRLSHMPGVSSDRDPEAVLQVCMLLLLAVSHNELQMHLASATSQGHVL